MLTEIQLDDRGCSNTNNIGHEEGGRPYAFTVYRWCAAGPHTHMNEEINLSITGQQMPS